jgi:hypothetical protein
LTTPRSERRAAFIVIVSCQNSRRNVSAVG